MGLAAGSVDLGSAATAAVINSIAGGNDFVAAYPSNGINDEVQSIFYVLEDSPIQSIDDIAGKTIAVNTLGAHLDYTVREALHRRACRRTPPTSSSCPVPQLEQVLRSGQVDIAAFGYWQTTFEGVARKNGGIRPSSTTPTCSARSPAASSCCAATASMPIPSRPASSSSSRRAPPTMPARTRRRPGRSSPGCSRSAARTPRSPSTSAATACARAACRCSRDIQFWIDVFEREGQIPEGKLVAEDLLLVSRRRRAGDELMSATGGHPAR